MARQPSNESFRSQINWFRFGALFCYWMTCQTYLTMSMGFFSNINKVCVSTKCDLPERFSSTNCAFYWKHQKFTTDQIIVIKWIIVLFDCNLMVTAETPAGGVFKRWVKWTEGNQIKISKITVDIKKCPSDWQLHAKNKLCVACILTFVQPDYEHEQMY